VLTPHTLSQAPAGSTPAAVDAQLGRGWEVPATAAASCTRPLAPVLTPHTPARHQAGSTPAAVDAQLGRGWEVPATAAASCTRPLAPVLTPHTPARHQAGSTPAAVDAQLGRGWEVPATAAASCTHPLASVLTPHTPARHQHAAHRQLSTLSSVGDGRCLPLQLPPARIPLHLCLHLTPQPGTSRQHTGSCRRSARRGMGGACHSSYLLHPSPCTRAHTSHPSQAPAGSTPAAVDAQLGGGWEVPATPAASCLLRPSHHPPCLSVYKEGPRGAMAPPLAPRPTPSLCFGA
jgi:hypothetical protein